MIFYSKSSGKTSLQLIPSQFKLVTFLRSYHCAWSMTALSGYYISLCMLLGFLAVILGVLQAYGLLSDPSSEF